MLKAEIFKKMSLHAKKSFSEASKIASFHGKANIDPVHLLFAIFLEKGSLGSNILKNIGIKEHHFKKLFPKKIKVAKEKESMSMSNETENITTKAFALASGFGYPYVGTEHLVYALVETREDNVQEVLQNAEPKEKTLDGLQEISIKGNQLPDMVDSIPLPDISISNKEASSPSTPNLDNFCTNLNEEAIKLNESISGRDEEISRIINILNRKEKNNPLLIGEPGVGKTAIIRSIAKKINSGDVPIDMLGMKIFSLDMSLVVAGTTFRGEFENRLKDIIKEATNNDDVILFIDEIHTIVGAGNSQGGLDAANILKPALARGELRCIGATTYSEYKKYIEKDPALARRFQPFNVLEPTPLEAQKMLTKLKRSYENFHNVNISKDAIEAAIDMSVRYVHDRFLPDKALDLLDETASQAKNRNHSPREAKKLREKESQLKKLSGKKNSLISKENYNEALSLQKEENSLISEIGRMKKEMIKESKLKKQKIDKNNIAETVARITGIPLEKIIYQDTSALIGKLEKKLNTKIIGQREAINKISDILTRSYAGVSNPERPAGSFLFLGPSGVGKTMTARKISEELFEGKDSLVRVDMSEFSESHTVAKLIGAPAGYVGYGEGGGLTEKIRHQPYSLVLFDEIEKAHPDILGILLQILEDGTLTDSEGKKASFRNCIVILTSNLGTDNFTSLAKMGFDDGKEKNQIREDFKKTEKETTEELSDMIRPEIINRLDGIITFNPLDSKNLQSIARLEIKALQKRLLDKSIELKCDSSAIKFLAEKSNDPSYGARLVRKNIQDMIEGLVAKRIISNKNGPKITVNLKYKNGKLSLS